MMRLAKFVSAMLLVGALAVATPAQGQNVQDFDRLLAEALEFIKAGNYAGATSASERLVALARQDYGEDSREFAFGLALLGSSYTSKGSYADAELVLTQSLAFWERAPGLYQYELSLVTHSLGELYRLGGKYDKAEAFCNRALAIREVLDPDNIETAQTLTLLTLVYQAQGKYGPSEPVAKRSLAIYEKSQGPDHPFVAVAANNLGMSYLFQAKYELAEPLFKRSLAIREKSLDADHPLVGTALNNLGQLYLAQGRHALAEPFYKRALAIRKKSLGSEHPSVGESLMSLAQLFLLQGKYTEAEPLYKDALAVLEKAVGPDHPSFGHTLSDLATVYVGEGRNAEAERLQVRALGVYERGLGPDHRYVATANSNLGVIYLAQDRTADAERVFKLGAEILEKTLGPDHIETGLPLDNLAFLYFAREDWRQAADYGRRSTGIIVRRAMRGTAGTGATPSLSPAQGLAGKTKTEEDRSSLQFPRLVKAIYRLGSSGHGMFETAQWSHGSEAAQSLAQMAARTAKGTGELADRVRERQDLVRDWQTKDKQLIAAKGEAPEKRHADAERVLEDSIVAIDTRIAEIDTQLAKDFPDYGVLASPKSLSVGDAQAQLREGEALILFLDTSATKPTPEETFIWVVTKTDSRWVRSEIGTESLKREVAALRCGLDYGGAWAVPSSQCAKLLKATYSEADHAADKPLPFDLNRAHELYNALFGQVAALIKDKHLLIVPSGPLTQLPFQVLVTERPDPALNGADAYRKVAWLARDHAITVLPSVSSLKALRALAKDSHASRPMIGFGNPLLSGPGKEYEADALAAQSKQSCGPSPPLQVASLRNAQRGVKPLGLRAGTANVAEIRSQVPLPETADELCAVARDAGADAETRLGASATEGEVKRLSEAGELARFRMLHFATHGTLAGQVTGDSEPGLLLTPPDKASETDDGYLSASEVAGLKLDADWVILSACNTAAGGADGAEALSGLARAFFYAGARSLLVSHWAVYSDVTVKLITGAMNRMADKSAVGRAEAMRQSMLALIDNGSADEAHPAYWGPFVVVGEGSARARASPP